MNAFTCNLLESENFETGKFSTDKMVVKEILLKMYWRKVEIGFLISRH